MVLSPYLWQAVYVIYYIITRSIYIYQTNCTEMVRVHKELTVEQKNDMGMRYNLLAGILLLALGLTCPQRQNLSP